MPPTKSPAPRKGDSERKKPTQDDMLRAEREVGKNIPLEMIGLDSEDAADLDVEEKATAEPQE